MSALDTNVEEETRAERRATNAAASTSGSLNAAFASNGGILFHPTEQSQIKESWKHLMRWSRAWRTVEDGTGILEDIDKVSGQAASCLHACCGVFPSWVGVCKWQIVHAGGCLWRGLLWNCDRLCTCTAERSAERDASAKGPLCLQRYQ